MNCKISKGLILHRSGIEKITKENILSVLIIFLWRTNFLKRQIFLTPTAVLNYPNAHIKKQSHTGKTVVISKREVNYVSTFTSTSKNDFTLCLKRKTLVIKKGHYKVNVTVTEAQIVHRLFV